MLYWTLRRVKEDLIYPQHSSTGAGIIDTLEHVYFWRNPSASITVAL
jgi:hypothetical protein